MTTTLRFSFAWTVLFSLIILLFLPELAIGQKSALDGMNAKERNFNTFSERSPSNIEAWKKHNKDSFFNHPDFGVLEDNAPCQNCVEDLSKREKDLRHFIDIDDPSRFYVQKAKGVLHRKSNDQWISIHHKLESSTQHVFSSPFHLNPLQINTETQLVRLFEGEESISFNNWSLHKRLNGEEIHVNDADWSNYSAGEDGIYVTDIFPGIDAELIVYPGSVKTNFIINELQIENFDALIFKDEVGSQTDNINLDFIPLPGAPEGVGEIGISKNGRSFAHYGSAIAYPKDGEKSMFQEIAYAISDNSIKMIIPKDWIEAYKEDYKLIIDPLVTGSNTLAQASITGSEYNASCNFDNSCDQFLTVPAPANATFDDVLWTFTYEAINGAFRSEGAVRFATGGCVSPSQAGFYWFCSLTSGGVCEGNNISVFNDLGSCLPSPSCNTQNVNFTMKFFRSCYGTAGCNNNYIGAFSPWTMTITGQTLAYSNISNPITVSSNTVCEGESINASTAGQDGVPAYTYNWSFDASGTPSVGNGASTSITFPNSGTVDLYSIVTDNCGNESSASVPITVNPAPTPTITGATTYCAGSSANISAPAGFSGYSWSNGATTQSTTVTDADNPITVTVTDANGCTGTSSQFNVSEQANINYAETIEICQGQSATIHGNTETTSGTYQQTFTTATCDSIATITLVVNPLPTITASATQTVICDGENTDVSASGGDTYSWDNSLGAGASHTVSPGSNTTYTVTGTDVNGCQNTDQVTITVNPLPTVNAGNDVSVCNNQDVTLTGSGTATNYAWDNGVTDGVAFTPPTGTTTYTVTGTDANGCENTDQLDVSVGSLPTVNAGADFEACEGESITLSGSGTATSYTWDNGVNDDVAFNATTTTTYTVTGTNSAGCSDTDQITITVNPLPTVDAGPDISICDGEDTSLTASGNADTYTWDNGISDGVNFTPSVGTTTYTVVAENTTTGCTNTDQVEVTVNPLPTVYAGEDTTICEGETLTFFGSGSASSYTWDNGVTNGTTFTPGAGSTTYTVTGTDANGCSATDDITVNTIPQPIADFTATPMSGQPPLDVDFSNQSSNGTSYDWDFGNGTSISNPSNTDESTTYTSTGSYEVFLIVSNGDCYDEASLIIVVEESPLNYVVPNVFTPNNDGSNDLFHMNVSNAKSIEIEIFNRWGNLVGTVNSLDPDEGWDGTNLNGAPVNDGVYFYTYKIIDLEGNEVTGHQYLHLERD